MTKLTLVLLSVLILTSCNDSMFYIPNICDSTIYHYQDSVLFRDSVLFFEKEVIIEKEVIWIRDSVAVSDTIRLIETGKGNLKISGAKQHVTFDIDLDSIWVKIRNDSIISVWQRPGKQ